MPDPYRDPNTGGLTDRESTGVPRWMKLVGIALFILVLLVVITMLISGGGGHGGGPASH